MSFRSDSRASIALLTLMIGLISSCYIEEPNTSSFNAEQLITKACEDLSTAWDVNRSEGIDAARPWYSKSAASFRLLAANSGDFTNYAEGVGAVAAGTVNGRFYDALNFCSIN